MSKQKGKWERAGDRLRAAARRVPLWAIAAPAAVSIWAGWVGLGGMCGFGVVNLLPGIADGFELNTAITLPVGMEAYSAMALGAWLTTRPLTDKARSYARWSALASLVLGLLGQVGYHVLTAMGYTRAPIPVVVFVASLPVLVLGAGAALRHLTSEPVPAEAPATGTTAVEVAPAVEAAGEPAAIEEATATTTPAKVPARRPGKRGSRKGRPAPRRLRADYLIEARAKLAAAEAGTDPSPSWCKRVTGCSDGTSMFLAKQLRTELANPATSDFANHTDRKLTNQQEAA
ncbi:hypothetical protein [Pseudonocardia spinosispora]|uniref:hypothetical protein n=1 Tax=Pseudonocardia spinosispora TaxID=103441 RepID=UPI0003FB39F3|nr:hypothetical protein [Pseudonocardia spinosispora]